MSAIHSKLANRKPSHGIQPKRLPDIIEQNSEWIVKHWLTAVKKDPEIGAIPLPDSERQDHIPRLLQESLERARGRLLTTEDTDAAVRHGNIRRKQGYTAPLVVREAKLLLQSLAECVQQNLLAIQVSYLIPDMVKAWETIETELEVAVMAFLDAAPESKARLTSVPDRRRRAPRSNRG